MKRNRRAASRTIIAVIVIVVIIIGAVGLGFYYYRTSNRPTALTNITVATLPTADYVPLYVAIQQGYFGQAGLNVTLKFLAGGALINPAIASGSVQIGATNPVALMTSHEQGFDIKAIAPASATVYPIGSAKYSFVTGVSTNAVVVLTSSGVTKISELAGKTYALNTLGANSQAVAEQMLDDSGVKVSSVNFVPVAPPNWVASLQQKRIDVAQVFEPFLTQIIQANKTAATVGVFRILADPFHQSSGVLYSPYAASASWISAHPDLVKAFIKALDMGVDAVQANPSLGRSVLVSTLHMSPSVAGNVTLYVYPKTPIPASWMAWQIQAALKWGLLKNPNNNISTIVDTAYLQLSGS